MSKHTFEVTDQNFQTDVINASIPVLVEFTADWCPPCKMLEPILDDIALKYQDTLKVGMLDSDLNTHIVQQYGVMGLPTLILFVDGEPVERVVGFKAKGHIESKILRHLTGENA